MPVQLDQIVPWGRSFDEYARMFALSERDLAGRVLDCAAGPSSFQAEARQRHPSAAIVSADPIYRFPPGAIRARVRAARDSMMTQVRGLVDQFVWDFIRSPQHLEQVRMTSMEKFLLDFSREDAAARYRPESLPTLSFPDASFDLALCSHYLFLYSDHLDTAFHLASVAELLRVAAEVRIFPATDLAGRPSPHLPAVRGQFNTHLVHVPYEFLRGANQMLVVMPRPRRR